MAVCTGIKRDGGRCTLPAAASSGLCWLHRPDRADERRRAASKAGRSRPSREIAQIKAALDDLYAAVESGQISPSVGAILNQITNTRLRSLEAERKVRQSEDMEARLEALELALGSQDAGGGSAAWGA